MSDIYSEFETDPELERRGVEVPIGDMTFTLRHAGGANKAYQKELDKKSRPYRNARTGELSMTDDQAMQMLYEVYARHIVVDWKGVKGRGKDIPYTEENCIKIFKDLPRFFLRVKTAAENIEFFQSEILEAEAGNSEPSSNTA